MTNPTALELGALKHTALYGTPDERKAARDQLAKLKQTAPATNPLAGNDTGTTANFNTTTTTD